MSTIIDSMHDGVTVIDERGQVLQRNPAGAEMIRSAPDAHNNVMDSKFAMTVDGQPRCAPADFPWVRAFKGENVIAQDMVLVFDDGSPNRTLSVSARRLPTVTEDGLRQAVVIYHDVTDDRAQRSELESFARVVAHDLLGPARRGRRVDRDARPRPGREADPDHGRGSPQAGADPDRRRRACAS